MHAHVDNEKSISFPSNCPAISYIQSVFLAIRCIDTLELFHTMKQQKESVPLAGSTAGATDASPNYFSTFQSQDLRPTNNSSGLKKTNPCKIILGIIIFLATLIILAMMYILFKQYAAEES